jgi:hypothetical protein
MLALFANKPNAAKMAKNIKKEFCKDDSESNMASIRGSVLDPSFSSKKVKKRYRRQTAKGLSIRYSPYFHAEKNEN